jgi:hypothetical protein
MPLRIQVSCQVPSRVKSLLRASRRETESVRLSFQKCFVSDGVALKREPGRRCVADMADAPSSVTDRDFVAMLVSQQQGPA